MKNRPHQILAIFLILCTSACEEPGFGVNGFYISDVLKAETGQNFSFSYDDGKLTGIYSDDPSNLEKIWYQFEYGRSGKIEKMSEIIIRQGARETRYYSIEESDLFDLIRTEEVEKGSESQIIDTENIRLFKKAKHGFVTKISIGDGKAFQSFDLIRKGANVVRRDAGFPDTEDEYEYFGYDSEINPFRNYLDRFGNLLVIPFTRIICKHPYAYDDQGSYIPVNMFSLANCGGIKTPRYVTSHGLIEAERHTDLKVEYNTNGLPSAIYSDPFIDAFEPMMITYQYR